MGFEDELGAQPPLGFFDPLGLLNGDVDQERFDRLRYVEIKHGRICMMGFLGQITTRGGLHLPGNIDFNGDSFDSFPNGIAALIGPDSIPTAGLVQLICAVGFLEIGFMKDVQEPEMNLSVTSETDTLTSVGMISMKTRSSPSVPSSSTTDVPPWLESLDS